MAAGRTQSTKAGIKTELSAWTGKDCREAGALAGVEPGKCHLNLLIACRLFASVLLAMRGHF